MEKEFNKFEKINGDKKYNEQIFEQKMSNFIIKYQNKINEIIEKLRNNQIEINIDINTINFKLLALNKITNKTKENYEKIKKIYSENIEKFANLSITEYKDIDYIENDVTAFLTDYETYLKSRQNDIFDYKLLDKICFDDSKITKYKRINKDLILEFDGVYQWQTVRLTFKNVTISDETNFKGSDICWCKYGNYEDYNYYMCFELVYRNNGDFYCPEVEFKADKIIVEQL